MDKHVYVERADPDAEGYEPGTRRWFNVIDRYKWANQWAIGITIDMPCGMGWGTSHITNADRVIGIDICPEAIKKAISLYANIEFQVGNMLHTFFPDEYADCVICCEGYEHVERKDQFTLMSEIYRILKPRGIALLTVPIARFQGDHTGNKFHLYEPTIEEVNYSFQGIFNVIRYTKPNVARFVLEAIK